MMQHGGKGGRTLPKMSPYASAFVPAGPNPAVAGQQKSRQRRGSDPALATAPREDADRHNPRLPYQLQPHAAPVQLVKREPYPGSPAAALRGQVYERLEEVGELMAGQGPCPEGSESQIYGTGVGSLAHMLPVMRDDGDKRAHSDIIQAFAKQSIRLEAPTDEQVDRVHQRLLTEMAELFEEHKAALGWGHKKIIFE